MSNIKTRTDCTRDNRQVYLENACTLGYGKYYAKRGNWIKARDAGYPRNYQETLYGRVIARVMCEGKEYLEICALGGNLDNPMIRWIKPRDVLECNARPPKSIFDFICGEWGNVDAIHGRINNGFLPEEIANPILNPRP